MNANSNLKINFKRNLRIAFQVVIDELNLFEFNGGGFFSSFLSVTQLF